MADSSTAETQVFSLVDVVPTKIRKQDKPAFIKAAKALDRMDSDSKTKRDLFNYYGYTTQHGDIDIDSGSSNAVELAAEIMGVNVADIRRVQERIENEDDFAEKWEELQRILEEQK